MKLLYIALLLGSSLLSEIPTDYGHSITQTECQCASKFKDTRTWTEGTRNGYYCIATSRNGNQYKRYFSQWLKLKR